MCLRWRKWSWPSGLSYSTLRCGSIQWWALQSDEEDEDDCDINDDDEDGTEEAIKLKKTIDDDSDDDGNIGDDQDENTSWTEEAINFHQ